MSWSLRQAMLILEKDRAEPSPFQTQQTWAFFLRAKALGHVALCWTSAFTVSFSCWNIRMWVYSSSKRWRSMRASFVNFYLLVLRWWSIRRALHIASSASVSLTRNSGSWALWWAFGCLSKSISLANLSSRGQTWLPWKTFIDGLPNNVLYKIRSLWIRRNKLWLPQVRGTDGHHV